MKKFAIFLLSAGISAAAFGQTAPDISTTRELPDSLRNSGMNPPEKTDSVRSPLSSPETADDAGAVAPLRPGLPTTLSNETPSDLRPFRYSMPTDGRIFLWRNGGVFGNVSTASMPGLMGVESGSIIFMQQAGRFTFTAHADAAKYGYFNGLQTTFGYGGSIGYRFSDRVSMTLFGSYYTPLNAGAMLPAVAGYTSVTNFGGYVNYQFSDHWGIKVGAQAYRRSDTGSFEAQPIAIPYYKISKNAEIGVDIGGMLYQILKGSGSSSHRMNPTIAPPKMGTLPVGPRR